MKSDNYIINYNFTLGIICQNMCSVFGIWGRSFIIGIGNIGGCSCVRSGQTANELRLKTCSGQSNSIVSLICASAFRRDCGYEGRF